ncbi:MAG: FAD-dependent oxidoreductase [Anaerolineaceae bacterium]|nr:FAD-dependent oxidoreductase [Anaerolineaceae bacterium]
MRTVKIRTDLVVAGGGMAGLVGAVAAARHGAKVVLVQDRPVLGGNASSEVRVWVGGAQGHTINRFAREGGILNEILLEQLHRNPHCSPPVWDAILLELVTGQPNITLLLDTAVDAVKADGPRTRRRVRSLGAFCATSQTRYEIVAPLVLDASGDSIVGILAGADYRLGKEGRQEFGEPTAPAKADPRCLGASLYFYSKDMGRPVPFVRPDFAIDVSGTPRIRKGGFDGTIQGCRLWWVEWGGELDTVHDSAAIKGKLTAIIYGLWDHIKNSGRFPEARNLDLEWVGAVPGKRESYRLMGPHILTEQDLFSQPDFPDACATGGWTIDHHPPRGFFSSQPPSRHITLPGPYNIPLRCLFSRNVENLLMAGRNISASNVAFGSIRLMGTGAVCGQAAGTAAAMCLRGKFLPARLAGDSRLLERFQQTLLGDDQHIIGLANREARDLARSATVTASSELVIRGAAAEAKAEPTRAGTWDEWLMVPVVTPEVKRVQLLVDASAATTMTVEIRRNDFAPTRHHYFAKELLARRRVRVPGGRRQWVTVPVDLALDEPTNLWFVVKKNRRLALHGSRQRFSGVLSSRGNRQGWPNPRLDLFAFRISPGQPVYAAANVINGYARPYIMPNLWVAGQRVGGKRKPWLELSWPQPRRIRRVQLYLSHDPDMQIPTMLMDYPFRAVPTILKDFSLYARIDGRRKRLARVRDNHRRMVAIDLERAVRADRLRLVAEATNGSPRAEVYEVRVY